MRRYYKTADSEWFKHRLIGAMFIVLVSFAILLVRLFYLQIIEGEEFRRLSANNCIRLRSIDAPRGLIFDRNAKLLVDNRPSFDLDIILKDATPVKKTLKNLSRYMNVPTEELLDSVSKKTGLLSYKPVLLKPDIGRDLLAAIQVHSFDLPGVLIHVRPIRNYIHNKSAAHLLGYLSEINSSELRSSKYSKYRSGDFLGKFGIEKHDEKYLRGRRGGQQVEVNATGQVVRVLSTVNAEPGYNLFLTLDYKLQQKAESLIKNIVGAAIAMDPRTGEILEMASSPSFDPNSFVTGMTSREWKALSVNPDRPMENKAIQAEYPPASTYKIVTAMAGLEEGVIDEDTSFFCPGYLKFGDRVFHCWKRGGHGNVNVIKALTESCDVFFYQVGQRLGIDRLAWYAKACGLGALTGVGLGHEASGLIPTASWKRKRYGVPWQRGETLSVAIGQGYNLVTPIQMLVLLSAVATDGVLKKPLVLKSVETVEGHVVKRSRIIPMGRLPASQKTLDIVRKGLWEVVNSPHGTARRSVHVKGLNICGKTGTVQVVSHSKDDTGPKKDLANELKAHAWFVAYAPYENPKIAVAVIIEHGEHGSSAAGPVARELIKSYLQKENGDV